MNNKLTTVDISKNLVYKIFYLSTGRDKLDWLKRLFAIFKHAEIVDIMVISKNWMEMLLFMASEINMLIGNARGQHICELLKVLIPEFIHSSLSQLSW